MKMSLPQVRKIILGASFLLLAFGGGYWLGQKELKFSINNFQPKITIERNVPAGKENVDFALFWEVWDRLELGYLDKSKIDYHKMVYGAISGMVASLGDPYTVFLPPTDQKQSMEDLAGSFEGVGIQLGYKDSKIAVIAPLTDTPADKAGVKAGDLILKIKDTKNNVDKDTTGMTLPDVVNLIRGPKGTEITLTLSREGKGEFDVTLKRDTILVKSVELSYKDKTAVIKLTRFGERTYEEWAAAVSEIDTKINKKEVTGVVLDLRNNPGGLLQGSIFIASEFLKDGVIVKQEKSANAGGTETYSVNRTGKLTNIPLVVLINPGSASASEIVAGALQERGRAKLVGEKSFGKGTVQEAEELVGGSGLHVTVARWLLPSGKNIDKEGVKPDVEVKMDDTDQTIDPQLDKALELLK
jgi:carboxyl-terminal processing protease